MHGIKRSRLSPQAAETKRLKELSKIEAYTTLQDTVLTRKKGKDYSAEALGQTTQLLDLNPEFYTIWNYRRQILLQGLFPASTAEEIVKLLTNDLRLTTAYLMVHPKVYWIWTHRKWCLESVPIGPGEGEEWRIGFWKIELGLIEKMLDVDARNFHAWDYRRYVLRSLPETFAPKRTELDELRYTQKKIEANFSNYSAWHLRSKILGGLWNDLSEDKVQNGKDKEFELVTQALWTDPGDQSGWLYHRWLVGDDPSEVILRREIQSIRELNEVEPDAKWCINALSRYILVLANMKVIDIEESESLRTEARMFLQRLETVDADRKERYRDLANTAGTVSMH